MASQTILICDDNISIMKSLKGYFEDFSYDVLYAESGEKALELFNTYTINLIILDIMLPGMSGTDVCLEIRKHSDVPILMLSAKADTMDRIIGLEIGADDYVTKPFSPREVVVRANKLLKRYSKNVQANEYNAGELKLLPDSYEVFVNEQRIVMSAKEFEVLRYLISHQGKVVTREHIINAVWGTDYLGEPRIIDTMVKRLRHKLGIGSDDSNYHFSITTVYGVGYKLEVLS